MHRDAAVAQATPWRLLPPAAVGHLAHVMRGCIHVIRGHAELLRVGLREDVIDLLRLPRVPRGEPVVLALGELLAAHGGHLLASGGRMELLIPTVSEA